MEEEDSRQREMELPGDKPPDLLGEGNRRRKEELVTPESGGRGEAGKVVRRHERDAGGRARSWPPEEGVAPGRRLALPTSAAACE